MIREILVGIFEFVNNNLDVKTQKKLANHPKGEFYITATDKKGI